MKIEKRLWIKWFFFVLLTLLPVFAAVFMYLFGGGFNLTIWIVSLLIACAAFWKAQETVGSMRSSQLAGKFEAWLLASEEQKTKIRSEAPGSSTTTATDRIPVASQNELDKVRTQYVQQRFWKGLEGPKLRREVGKLFHGLGRQVRRMAARGKLGEGLLLNADTYVVFADAGEKPTRDEAKTVDDIVNSDPSLRWAMLVSPHGFKRAARSYAEKRELLLLDAEALSRLARTLKTN
jgi:hypothetical protein